MADTYSLTEGKVYGTMLKFFFPMLLTNLLQQLYTVADTAIVGSGLGDNALGAVGNAATLSLFITGFIQGLTGGFSVVVSQNFGARYNAGTRKSIGLSIGITAVISVTLTVFSEAFMEKVLHMIRTDGLIFGDSLLYSRIIFGGLIITAAYNLASGILCAIGDSKTPLIAITVSSAVNILLDLWFIFGVRTGVEGAAAATLTAQLLSVVICCIKLKKTLIKSLYENSERCKCPASGADEAAAMPGKPSLGFDGAMVPVLLRNSLPMAFMNSLTAVGCLIVQSYINALSADCTAAYTVCTRYLNLFMLPSITAGFTVSAFTGQNYGAGKIDRIRSGVKTGLLIAFASYILLGGVMLIIPRKLAELMANGESVILMICDYLQILGITIIAVNCIFIFRSAVQAMGKPTVPMLSGIAEMALRIAAIMLLLPEIGYTAAAYADLIAWLGALAMNIIAYLIIIKKASVKSLSESR